MAIYRFLFSNPFPSDIQKMETFQGALHLPSPCTPRRAGSLVKLAGSASHKQEHTISCKWFSYFLAGREGVRALTTKSPPRLRGTFPFKGLLHRPPLRGSTHKAAQPQASLCISSQPPRASAPLPGRPSLPGEAPERPSKALGDSRSCSSPPTGPEKPRRSKAQQQTRCPASFTGHD